MIARVARGACLDNSDKQGVVVAVAFYIDYFLQMS